MRLVLAVAFLVGLGGISVADDNRIDIQRPDAPELAAPGPYDIGVRTLDLVREDVPNVLAGGTYDRPVTVEVWYPADLQGGAAGGDYVDVQMANSDQKITLHGQAVRDAAPLAEDGPYPLVILSHGFPGNRFLISHFGENLASKGFVVASIDHFESTYENQLGFASTLANRSPDQLFVLDAIASGEDFLDGMVDGENSAIIGYSMGGYGALISGGAGLAPAAGQMGMASPEALAGLMAGSDGYDEHLDPRVKAVVAIGPWGGQVGLWDEVGFAGIEIPLLVMGGSLDEVSNYETGIRRIFEGAVNSDRYLLTFQGAGHNAAAPMPPPVEASEGGPGSPFEHYADFVWDNARMNNIAQHFVTAFLGLHLKGDETMEPYLAVGSGSWNEPAGDRAWKGFGERTTRGLVWEILPIE
ncbi:alpha/beta hydrolase family protein [Devosia sediminis]|uniref:Dienelactone hydrolase n=1 Tax=Devosia sediminis TaxID=2798801 RepID=A0A934MJ81_9HYPH|nr:dienelactone hydrolase [Devosia sediminis]MBJ3783783.1 dienelactone hydrolase [Devosia sediminis]